MKLLPKEATPEILAALSDIRLLDNPIHELYSVLTSVLEDAPEVEQESHDDCQITCGLCRALITDHDEDLFHYYGKYKNHTNVCGSCHRKLSQKYWQEQPNPTPNTSTPTWELVMRDMENRNKAGIEKYGTPLQPNNGRNSLKDAYEEALDLAVYLKNAIIELESGHGN